MHLVMLPKQQWSFLMYPRVSLSLLEIVDDSATEHILLSASYLLTHSIIEYSTISYDDAYFVIIFT